MDNNWIQETVCEVIGVSLGGGGPVDGSFSRAEQSAWDSLRHIEILLALEDRFNIQFSESDMQDMDSVRKIAQRIAELV